ncbi:hypothetical protein D3C81_2023590 [compost metagenome]
MTICAAGSLASDAAMVTISAPRKANITPSKAPITVVMPLGMKPSAVRWLMPRTSPNCQTFITAAVHTTRKQTMAITLIKANQNSNSP